MLFLPLPLTLTLTLTLTHSHRTIFLSNDLRCLTESQSHLHGSTFSQSHGVPVSSPRLCLLTVSQSHDLTFTTPPSHSLTVSHSHSLSLTICLIWVFMYLLKCLIWVLWDSFSHIFFCVCVCVCTFCYRHIISL